MSAAPGPGASVRQLGVQRPHPDSPLPIPARTRPLRMLAAELEASDPCTSGHSRRVARYSTLVGTHLGLTGGTLRRLRTAAMLHDVGKIAVPAGLLRKPGRLSASERTLVRRHAAEGAAMIDALVGDAALSAIVRHHHERLDGGGYPDGLAGVAIPLGARIVAVADTFDAVVSRRAHRAAGSFQEGLETLTAAAGDQLDPDVVDGFCLVFDVLPGMGSLDLFSAAGERLLHGAQRSLADDVSACTADPAG